MKNNITLQVLQASDYYPFGLSFNQYQADRLKETSPGNFEPELRNRYLFQGQELQKDLDLGWYQFKWRMHDPAIGRFGAVDPLAVKYPYWSTYAFSGNQVIAMVELEGLEPTSSLADAQSLLNQYKNDLSESKLWPNISPESFLASLEANISDPSSINQGVNSWFCGNAACNKYVAQNDPTGYVKLMTDLYKTGTGTYDAGGTTVTFSPSESVRKDAGNLKYSGLAGNAANQMMFLTLSDHYKGYFNKATNNMQYDPGDASNTWASTTLGEFKRMMGDFGYNVNTYGGDLGWANLNKGGLAQTELSRGNDVFLYVNSDLFKNNAWWKNWSATHYIQLNKIGTNNNSYNVNFWDYGAKKPKHHSKSILVVNLWFDQCYSSKIKTSSQ
ncbi:MAG: hypothetical protein HWD62_00840 [Cyclobacteriaceae bacterium]|nr:MAG: hypothetical protein HWD62_00840 [Cyclobacteriaceae bacterium]